jgi:hypothetical protein
VFKFLLKEKDQKAIEPFFLAKVSVPAESPEKDPA